jgi:hypothetical protein
MLSSWYTSSSSNQRRNLVRNSAFLRSAFLLLALASPSFLLAQFQQPTDEELKMTTDPKAPGADAVFLNIEDITDDPLHYQSYYARIKVLTEKGKDLATVEIPYQRTISSVREIKARTIHSDGTIIPLVGKPEDLLIAKTVNKDGNQAQFNRTVFTLPSVEVGSILEYRYQIQLEDSRVSQPHWEIQGLYFVHKAHYFFTPFKAFLTGIQNTTNGMVLDGRGRAANTLIWWPKLPPGMNVTKDVGGRFSVDVTDIPPAPHEEWMPPISSFLYRVIFDYSAAGSGSDFWISEAKLWSKDVDRFADPSKPIHEAVDGLIAPTDSELDKAKKLYKAVQALDNTDYSRHKSEAEMKQLKLKVAKRAEDTWAQKSGSSEDIAQLYLAMLRAAGLTAYAMTVVDRSRGVFDPYYPSFSQFDDTLVILSTGGKEIFLDPGEKMCPFQNLSWRHSGAGGIRQTANDRTAGTTPFQAYTDNKILRIGDVTLDPHGAVTAGFRIVMTGQEALHWRQTALRNDLEEVKKQFDRSLEFSLPDGMEAHIDSFTGLDDPQVNLVATVKAKGSLGTATSKRLLLPGFFFQSRGALPFVAQEKRLEPVDMHYGDQITDQVTYHLPVGFSVEGAPPDAKITWPEHAMLVNKTVPAPGQITIARMLARSFTLAKPEDYQDLRGFYQKVAAADLQQLVLTVPPAPKGN